MMSCCATCGEPCDGTYCTDHQPHRTPDLRRHRTDRRRDLDRTAWKTLSRRARTAQPFCTVCGTTTNLQTDHSPRAWARQLHGLPIRLSDVAVLCQRCNITAGAARPGHRRYQLWQTQDGDLTATTPDHTIPTWGVTPDERTSTPTARPRFRNYLGFVNVSQGGVHGDADETGSEGSD